DVVSPGVNVLSSIPLSFCGTDARTCWAFFQGTSMSSPHTAGSAAVVIDAFVTRSFDGYTAEQVRSAITNTAEQGVLTSYTDGTTKVSDVNIVGAGQVDLDSAVLAKVGVGPVSTSFGAVPGGSGQTLTKSVSLSSLTGTQQSLRVSLDDPADAADFRAPATTVTIPATGTTQISVSVVLPKGASAGDYQADLNLSSGAVEVAHSVLYVHIK
ncbi:MAG: S8 family serine peptidase, partial [Actinomycetota bacterium]|nr:S8 family serine peptidase [Actinomycetota bacterium]